jgi:hypothetical protein
MRSEPMLSKSDWSQPPGLEESEILSGWALRFDGWKFVGETGWSDEDRMEAERRMVESLEFPESQEMQLCLFFFRQRFLFKWGGDRLSPQGYEWRAFRELFLRTYRFDVAKKWRMDEYYGKWRKNFYPKRDEHVRLIETLHRQTQYRPDAPLIGP